MLPTPHFHVVFALPSELRALFRRNPRTLYGLFFGVVSGVLTEAGRDRLEARMAVVAVLHTWTRELNYHPHIHALVSAGGLHIDDDRWVPTRLDYLFPVARMRHRFRRDLLKGLDHLVRRGLLERAAVRSACRGLRKKRWVVHVDAPDGRGPEQVVRYLARYVYKVALSDHRVARTGSDGVTFRTRGSDTITLDDVELTRRYLLHLLPKGFRKVRCYGLLAPGNVNGRLEVARLLLGSESETDAPDEPDEPEDPPATAPACPRCALPMRWVEQVEPCYRARGPPAAV